MPRYTIARHAGAPDGEHFDFFLEHGRALKTWRIGSTSFSSPQQAVAAEDHRPKYLDYEGDLTEGRGRVEIWDTGEYQADIWERGRIRVGLCGRKLRTRLLFSTDDAAAEGGSWTLADATEEVRRLATAILRRPDPEPAPDTRLDRESALLLGESQRIFNAVDRFGRGLLIEWPLAPLDADLLKRLRQSAARWKHPWLDDTVALAEGLDGLVKAMNP